MAGHEIKKRFRVRGNCTVRVRSDGALKEYTASSGVFHEYPSKLPGSALARGEIEELPGAEERRRRNRSSGSSKSGSSSGSKSTSSAAQSTGEQEGVDTSQEGDSPED